MNNFSSLPSFFHLLIIFTANNKIAKKKTNNPDNSFPSSRCPPPSFSRPPLILVSLDGFRAAYLKDHASHLPVISKLSESHRRMVLSSYLPTYCYVLLPRLLFIPLSDRAVSPPPPCRESRDGHVAHEARLPHQDLPQPLQHRDCECPRTRDRSVRPPGLTPTAPEICLHIVTIIIIMQMNEHF